MKSGLLNQYYFLVTNQTHPAKGSKPWGKERKGKKIFYFNSLALGKRQTQHMVLSATPKPGKLQAASDDYNAAFSCPFSHGFIAGKGDVPQP